jgi:hypothetical protein
LTLTILDKLPDLIKIDGKVHPDDIYCVITEGATNFKLSDNLYFPQIFQLFFFILGPFQEDLKESLVQLFFLLTREMKCFPKYTQKRFSMKRGHFLQLEQNEKGYFT